LDPTFSHIPFLQSKTKVPMVALIEKMFTPFKLGSMMLPNRFIMAPLTRCRADLHTNMPNALMKEYYVQRAPYAGLIITEFTTILKGAVTFHTEAGIWNDEQATAWKDIVDAVHDAGGRIFCQIAHGGRAAHPLNNNVGENQAVYVAPSPIALSHTCNPEFNPTNEKQPYPAEPPHELTDEEALAKVEQFRLAAHRAVKIAGFDGVEVHGANGYLIDQFLCAASNHRTYGRYAGTSLETRSQFLKDILTAVVNEVGADKVGLRISPFNSYNDMSRGTPEKSQEEVTYLARMCNDFDIAYMHIMRADFFGIQQGDAVTPAREAFKNALIVNMGYEVEEAEQGVADKKVDFVAFGTKFLSNPDLPERVKSGHPLTDPNPALFYTKEAAGYTDYPFMAATN
jgi:N-ethylmaleimide reductase